MLGSNGAESGVENRGNGAESGTGNGGNGVGRGLPPPAWLAALAVVTVGALVLFGIGLYQLRSASRVKSIVFLLVCCDEDDEGRVTAEIGRYLKEEKVSCDGRWAISRPVVFRPDVGDEVADEVDERTIHRFLKRPALRKVKKLYVLGFASADGPREVNDELAWQRAGTVAETIRRRRPTLEVEKYGLGEDHLTEGVASSRSARIVACVPAVEHEGC